MAQVYFEDAELMPRIPPVRGWRWAVVKPHGTLAAVRRHYRHKTRLCDDCLKAQTRGRQDYRARVRDNGGLLGGRWPQRVVQDGLGGVN